MRSGYFAFAILLSSYLSFSQNDQDALRYSQIGVGGTARFTSMGGAMGALGGNVSCLSYNPAGIGIYRKGELNISPGVNFSSINSTYNGTSTKYFTPSLVFNGLGIAGSWQSRDNEDVRHSLGLSINQLQNFNSQISISGTNKGSSISQDLMDGVTNTTKPDNFDPSYTGLAWKTYLVDYDSTNNKYYSFIDPNVELKQTKDITRSGKMNEFAFGYTYAFRDKLYLGASIGIPSVSYNHNATYTETDVNDSLRIYRNTSGVQSTYTYNTNVYYASDNVTLLGGFKSMTYDEVYKTTGRGFNLKLGAIYRVNDFLRIGANYQTPTVLNLTDVYSYSMTTTFDSNESITESYPENGGTYHYKIVTPMRYGASIGFIYKKLLAIGIDYEGVNYGQAYITSNEPSYFTSVNKVISSKYSSTSNIRAGAEVNIENVFVRAGYAMYGSPFGNTFGGKFSRTSYSGGVGFRNRNWAFDLGFVRYMYSEDYYMYNAKYANKTDLQFFGTNFVATVGCKF